MHSIDGTSGSTCEILDLAKAHIQVLFIFGQRTVLQDTMYNENQQFNFPLTTAHPSFAMKV